MRFITRFLTAALAGLLCLTPFALAQGVQGSGSLHTDRATGAADLAAGPDSIDASADAAVEDAATLDAEADHAVSAADGLWAWLSRHFVDIVARLGGMLADGPAVDASADVQAGLGGVSADVGVGGVTLGQSVGLPAVGAPLDLGAGAALQINAGSALGLG